MTCDFKSATKLFPIPENPPGPLPELLRSLKHLHAQDPCLDLIVERAISARRNRETHVND
jgi:hypothetical protein